MTVAVCLRCGEFKHGAWTPCPKCRYMPQDDESLTRHLIVTDHFMTREQLEEVSARVKAGGTIEFPPELLEKARVRKADVDRAARRFWMGCLLVLALAAVAAAFWVWR